MYVRVGGIRLKCCASFLVSNATQSIHVFCACCTAELERSNGWRGIGLEDLTLNLVIPTFYMSHLLTERK